MLIKILNKLIYYLKNILLPILLIATIFIVMMMYNRLEKDVFGANLQEFISVIFPFILLLILYILNSSLHQNEVKNNIFYNITSLIVMITILIFCYRTKFDKNLIFWHKYEYNMNFNYFADQLSAIKIMLYGLSVGNILLMISNYIKEEKDEKINNNSNKKNKINS